MKDINDPKIVYTLPYFTYLKFQRWKIYFWVLLTAGILGPIFMLNLALITAITPKPLMNHILGITPEMAQRAAERDAISDRQERFDKAEKARNEAIAKQRQTYTAEDAAKYRADMAEIFNHAKTDDANVRFRAFK